jgi:3-isopropylmalate/(R)-2-methylmalate dehydratase small subunit
LPAGWSRRRARDAGTLHHADGDRGTYGFHDLRFTPDGAAREDFILNRPPFDQAGILVAARNFGVGSSREAAVYALLAMGIRCVVAESFGDIFFSNALKNGLLPVRLPEPAVAALRGMVLAAPGTALTVDLPHNRLTAPDGTTHGFTIPPFARDCLLRGLDEIGLTLTLLPDIEAFEAARPGKAAQGAHDR